MRAGLAGAEKVGDATSADFRMCSVCANIGAVMPATLAFPVNAGRYLYAEPCALPMMYSHARSNESKLQVIPQSHQGLVWLARIVNIKLGLQG